jgi:methionyl-tRNA formyltransferase
VKIVFFGNGDFGIPSLDFLLKEKKVSLVSVITNQPKKAGRGLKPRNTPIHDFCIKSNINYILNDNLHDIDLKLKLLKMNPDLFVVVSYKIMPESIFSLPKYGSINLHPSLLPKYRGASPIQYTLFNGDKYTGISIFKLSSGIDSGKILFQKKIKVPDGIIFTDLYNILSIKGADSIEYSIKHFFKLINELKDQESKKISKAPKIVKNDRIIYWDSTADYIYNKIRGLSKFPGAIARFNNKDLIILKAEKSNIESNNPFGTMYLQGKDLYVSTKTNSILIKVLKLSGKKEMTSHSFISGYGKFLPQVLNG